MKYNIEMKIDCTYDSGYGEIDCDSLVAEGNTLSELLDDATIFLIGNDGDDLGEIKPDLLNKTQYNAIRTELLMEAIDSTGMVFDLANRLLVTKLSKFSPMWLDTTHGDINRIDNILNGLDKEYSAVGRFSPVDYKNLTTEVL
jgi:hypothetical protein